MGLGDLGAAKSWRHPGTQPLSGAAAGRAGTAIDAAPSCSDAPDFLAELHPLVRQFVAYRGGRLDGRPHSLEDAAAYFGVDPAFAQMVDQYLQARRRLYLSRAGWRASRTRGR